MQGSDGSQTEITETVLVGWNELLIRSTASHRSKALWIAGRVYAFDGRAMLMLCDNLVKIP